MRRVRIVAALLLLSTPAFAASTKLQLCRGGPEQGKICTADAGCQDGVCRQSGHPTKCAETRRCLDDGVQCSSNYDCAGWPTNSHNYCPPPRARFTTIDLCSGNDPDVCGFCQLTGRRCIAGDLDGSNCTSDSDCPGGGVCMIGLEVGELDGADCLSDLDCGTGTCGLSEPGSTCILGYDQKSSDSDGDTMEKEGDSYADYAWGSSRTPDDDIGPRATASSAWGTGVSVDPGNGDVYFAGLSRISRFAKPMGDGENALAVLGQYYETMDMWERVPADLTVAGMGKTTASTLYYTGFRGSAVDSRHGVWVSDVHRVVHYPGPTSTAQVADGVLGVPSFDGYGGATFDMGLAAGVAVMQKCSVESENPQIPCTDDSVCGAGGSCVDYVAVADANLSRIGVWASVHDLGQVPHFVEGQANFVSTSCNRGGSPAANTLCGPYGVAWDSAGHLYAVDTYNNRVLQYPIVLAGGDDAIKVGGQPNFTTITAGTSSTTLRFPMAAAFLHGANAETIVIADADNQRAVVGVDFAGAGDAEWDHVIGTTSMTANTGTTECGRLEWPIGIAADADDFLYVSDYRWHRANQFDPDDYLSTDGPNPLHTIGQSSCTHTAAPVHSLSFDNASSTGAIIPFVGNDGRIGCVATDTARSRGVAWDNCPAAWEGVDVEPDSAIAQDDFVSGEINKGTSDLAGLNLPRGACWVDWGGGDKGILIADRGNNRFAYWRQNGSGHNFTTGAAPDLCIGSSGSCSSASSCAASDTAVCEPWACHQDAEGTVWLTDRGNGRVVALCTQDGALNGTCTSGNIGDLVFDAVVGREDLTTGFDHDLCSSPTAATLCLPGDAENDSTGHRLFVSDQDDDTFSTRVQVYEYGTDPFPTAAAEATFPLGVASGSSTAYGTTFPGIPYTGACTDNGSATANMACTQSAEWHPAGYCEAPFSDRTCTSDSDCGGIHCNPMRCVGGAHPNTDCFVDGDCADGDVCGCKGTGGFCDWRRTDAGAGALALDPVSGVLVTAHGGGAVEWRPPFAAGMGSSRILGQRTWQEHHTGYITSEWGRETLAGLDFSSRGDLFIMTGVSGEIVAGPLMLSNLAGTPQPSNTPSPTVTGTPPTPTETRTVAPSYTPTITRTPTITGTPTETETPTITETPTETETPEDTATTTETPTVGFTDTPTPTEGPTDPPTPTPTLIPGCFAIGGHCAGGDLDGNPCASDIDCTGGGTCARNWPGTCFDLQFADQPTVDTHLCDDGTGPTGTCTTVDDCTGEQLCRSLSELLPIYATSGDPVLYANADGNCPLPFSGDCPAPATPTPTATPQPTRRVFVTSLNYFSNFGGLEGADAACQERAASQSLGSTWRAWLSTSTVDAKDRIGNWRWVLMDGTLVAVDLADLLDDSIGAAIGLDESSSDPPDVRYVITGTHPDGTAAATCEDWTSTSDDFTAAFGDNETSNTDWTYQNPSVPCSVIGGLYCFETDLVTPTPTITVTETPTETPTITETPTQTPTISQTPTITRTPTLDPSTFRMCLSVTLHDGNLGGLAGADALCQSDATAAGLTGTWHALLSTSTVNANTRIDDNYWVTCDNHTTVATTLSELFDGAIDNAISMDLAGATINSTVGTGTTTAGVATSFTCNDWTSASSGATVTYGSSTSANSEWVNRASNLTCQSVTRLYCVEVDHNTPTPIMTRTETGTRTQTPSQTATSTQTPTVTTTRTQTPTITETPTQTPSVTNTPSRSMTPSNTPTATSSSSPTGTPSGTPTSTATGTSTSTLTETAISTPTRTSTATQTPTITPTITPSTTPSWTMTPTVTSTQASTATPSVTWTPPNTSTPTITKTPTRTRTPTRTATGTRTQSPTISMTPTRKPTKTPTPATGPVVAGGMSISTADTQILIIPR